MLNLPPQYIQNGKMEWTDVIKVLSASVVDPEWINLFTAEQLKWERYTLIQPLLFVPDFSVAPFLSWRQKYFQDQKMLMFSDLVEINTELHQDEYLNSLIDNFPSETTIIALLVDEKIFVIEGFRRCCAIALAVQRQRRLKIHEFKIILAECSKKKMIDLGLG